ncbi:ATP-binding protein, partial [Cyanobacterium stanieri LEGE 03274]
MSSNINWQNLRSWGGSQHTGFEELCCQLAAYESVPQGLNFVRKGTPDGGVECYWILPNGDEWGLQAKFFLSVGHKQWTQLDESVKTFLEKHPRMVSYTICIPLDRADPRKKEEKWFMDKWNERVEKWKNWAKEKDRTIEFIYWGEHEIFERLSSEEHRGRYFFWFNTEQFSQRWFKARLDETISDAGTRYTPELNIELPIAKLFDGLGRTKEFLDRIKIIRGEIKRSLPTINNSEPEESIQSLSTELYDKVTQLLDKLYNLDTIGINKIDFVSIKNLASESYDYAYEYIDVLKNIKSQPKDQTEKENSHGRDYNYTQHNLYELIKRISSLERFAESNEALLANLSALLLLGKGGIGKTHLLCDIAQNRTKSELPTVLLLGEKFNDTEPWSQIIRHLKLSCSEEEFLGGLESSAQAKQSKALILIDALNEGEGRKLWKKYLAGMLTTLSNYPWISIAVSVRTPYKDDVIPKSLDATKLIEETHYGFIQHEDQATKTFFHYFGIKRPSIPLLNPEFQNPLFLKLFCKGLENKGMTEVPKGFYGIKTVFDFFIDSVNEKLAQEEYLDFDEKDKPVNKAINKLAELMAKGNKQWLEREEAKSAVNNFLPSTSYHNSLFRHLVIEGLLAEDKFYQRNDQWEEGIRFTYERLSDHLIVKYLLDESQDLLKKYKDNPNEINLLPIKQYIDKLVKNKYYYYQNQGLIEAFSIQIPEIIQKELIEILPYFAQEYIFIESFIESLIWRKPESITEGTLKCINEYVVTTEGMENKLFNAFLTVSTNIDHPYNADFLHRHLKQLEMPKRDALWSIFLHYEYGEHKAVDSLVDWAWSSEDKSHIEDDAIRLCAIALAWFLTTSNRFLRDRATKGLVSILTPKIYLLNQIIPEFLDVNDLYVLERLFAVAYGCAMRSTNYDAIEDLAKNIYNWIFKDGKPIPHILLRDYARGVIEIAFSNNSNLDIDINIVRPPYNSDWLDYIPTEEDLEQYKNQSGDIEKTNSALSHISYSLSEWGDFSRYIIGTNYNSFHWTSQRLNQPIQLTTEEIYNQFVESLTEKQTKLWRKYQNVKENIEYYLILEPEKKIEIFKQEFTEKELEEAINDTIKSLKNTLGKKKTKILEESIIPYLNNKKDLNKHHFDLSIAKRWIFWKVFDLGWNIDLFGDFDSFINYRDGRTNHKAERIGKKYQWLAYHEFLARVSDNFYFKGDDWNQHDKKGYQGSWQIGIRDIDPSCLLKDTPQENLNNTNPSWWCSSNYNGWDSMPDNIEWLKSDLPSIEKMIEIIKPEDNSQWFALENYYTWKEPTPVDEDKYKYSKREIWYQIRSYIVKKEDINCLYDWACNQDFMGRWMPESHENLQIFLG